ncbi:MAG: hypothetical protein WCP28_13390 [Actinomycetes bacterium]
MMHRPEQPDWGALDTYLGAKYRRIAARRGPIKAIVALEHRMLIAIWNMITNGEFHDDPGSDH